MKEGAAPFCKPAGLTCAMEQPFVREGWDAISQSSESRHFLSNSNSETSDCLLLRVGSLYSAKIQKPPVGPISRDGKTLAMVDTGTADLHGGFCQLAASQSKKLGGHRARCAHAAEV